VCSTLAVDNLLSVACRLVELVRMRSDMAAVTNTSTERRLARRLPIRQDPSVLPERVPPVIATRGRREQARATWRPHPRRLSEPPALITITIVARQGCGRGPEEAAVGGRQVRLAAKAPPRAVDRQRQGI